MNLTKNLLMAMILLVSCNSTDITPVAENQRSIIVKADVMKAVKAGYETDVLLPEKFVMDIIQGRDRYNYTMVEMSKKDGSNEYSALEGIDLLWADDEHDATVKAMTVPFGLSAVDAENPMIVAVCLDQSEADNVAASDLLGATSETDGGITISSDNINIEFKHLLSKLLVKYSIGSEFNSSAVSVNFFTLNDVCVEGKYSYASMDYLSEGKEYDDITMFHDASAKTAEAIFFPYKPVSNPSLLLNATIDGVEYNFTCPVVPKGSDGFVGGKRYILNVSIVGSQVSGTTASIAVGWDNNTEDKSFVTE